MKTMRQMVLSFAAFLLLCSATSYAENLSIGVVNFKQCVDQSKIGKEEHQAFENMRKEMEKVLGDKEKELTEIAKSFEDPDYLDSLSPEAEEELKRKGQLLNQELTQHQQQYYQVLNQANFKVINKINGVVKEAAKAVAKQKNIDLVINEEHAFFYDDKLDISTDVIALMDEMFDKEKK